MEMPGNNTTYPRTFTLPDSDFLLHHANFVPDMEDVTGTVKIMEFLQVQGSVNRSQRFLNQRLRPAIKGYLESANLIDPTEITSQHVSGLHYVLSKIVTNQSFLRLFSELPAEHILPGAITLLRRDSLAQTINSLNNKLSMLTLYGIEDDTEADFAKSGNFSLGNYEGVLAFGARQEAFDKGQGLIQALAETKLRMEHEPSDKQEYWLDVFKNIKRCIFAAHYFISLYPLHHQMRAEVLAYLGIQDTFPHFQINEGGELTVLTADGEVTGAEAIKLIIELVANNFMHLNSLAVR